MDPGPFSMGSIFFGTYRIWTPIKYGHHQGTNSMTIIEHGPARSILNGVHILYDTGIDTNKCEVNFTQHIICNAML